MNVRNAKRPIIIPCAGKRSFKKTTPGTARIVKLVEIGANGTVKPVASVVTVSHYLVRGVVKNPDMLRLNCN